jgi:hypothetical protein
MGNNLKRIKTLAAALFLIAPLMASADIIIEYSEVGSDLILEWSGSLNVDATTTFAGAPLTVIGNQPKNGTINSVFYSAPSGYSGWGTFTGVASAPMFWGVDYDNSGNSATGDNFLFRYNVGSTLQIWGDSPYSAGDAISGVLTAGEHSIASSGITPWSFVIDGGIGTIAFIQKGQTVPEPGVLALMALGIAGIGMTRRKKKACS